MTYNRENAMQSANIFELINKQFPNALVLDRDLSLLLSIHR